MFSVCTIITRNIELDEENNTENNTLLGGIHDACRLITKQKN